MRNRTDGPMGTDETKDTRPLGRPTANDIAIGMANYTPPRTIEVDELADRLAELDIYKPGLSYAETARLIMEV